MKIQFGAHLLHRAPGANTLLAGPQLHCQLTRWGPLGLRVITSNLLGLPMR